MGDHVDYTLGTLRDEPLVSKRRPVFFEYTLMDGVNDTADDAARLPELLAGIPCRLNVIPLNPYLEAVRRGSPPEAIVRFTAAVHAGWIRVTVRRDRGTDIAAACGQLATTASRPSAHS
jgi:23S rRNA (adenine2503-C2)-methyltransferase